MTLKSALCAAGVVLACTLLSLPAAGDMLLDFGPASVVPRARRVVFVNHTDEPPTLDGRLDEPVWQATGAADQWIDRLTNTPGDIDASVRVLHGPDHLYLAFTLRGIKNLDFRKPSGGGDEYGGSVFEMFFDPNTNNRTKVQLVTNPHGLRYDAYDYRTKDFTGTWQSASTIANDTWTAEIAIPYTEMNNQSKSRHWNANFCITLNDGDAGSYSWTGGWGDPDTDYGMLYFDSRETYEQSLRTIAELYLDRRTYDVRDVAAKALLRIDAVGSTPAQLSASLRAAQDDRVIAEQTIASLPSNALEMTLDLKPLPVGDYTLQVDIKRGDKVVATAKQPFTKRDRGVEPPAVMRGRIPIRVHAQPDLPGVAWPISTGMPFSPGSLTDADHVRLLDSSGHEVPCQVSVRSTWSPNGPIQWLGVDFIPTLAAEAQSYTLEYGPDVRRTMAGQLKVTETADAITVDTGPLAFNVDRKRFNLIASAAMGGRSVWDTSGGGLSLVDHEGNVYRAALDRDVEVTVEEAGPIRATICAKGWYVREGSDGSVTSVELPTDRLCLFTVRLTAASGSTLVKAAVSTTITYDTTKVRLRELTIGLPAPAPGSVRVGEVTLNDGDYLLQDRHDRAIDASGGEHPRCEGWIETPSMRVAMRRFWQLFPKEIGYADGLVTLHPWPAHGHDVFAMDKQTDIANIGKLWYVHHGRELDFTFPQPYFDALDGYYGEGGLMQSYARSNYYQQMKVANAQGLNIHNDLLLSVGDQLSGETLARLVNTDPHAVADPEYVCGTGVFGDLLHADEDFAELDNTFARGYRHITEYTQEAGEEYGQFIFGNLHTVFDYGRKTGILHRLWSNGHYAIARIPFIQYCRTGDAMWMNWGRDHANTLRDIAMVHYVSAQRSFPYHQLGAMYHCKGFAPWAGDAHVAAHPICMDFLIYDYYLYGNRRSLDALHDWTEGIKTSNPGGYATREGMTTLAELTEAYRLTWDAALIELMDRFRSEILREPFEKANSWDYHTLLLSRDWHFYGDQRMVDAYRRIIEMYPGGGSHYANIHYDGFFALLDNDRARVADYETVVYRDGASVLDRPDLAGDGLSQNQWIRFAYQMHKYPYLLKAMKQFGLKPRRPERTTPLPLPTAGSTARVVVEETKDQPFTVTIRSTQARPALPLRVVRGDGQQVASAELPAADKEQAAQPVTIEVPSDGVAGQYVIVIDKYDVYTAILWPLTDVKHEVAVAPPQTSLNVMTSDAYARFDGGGRLFFAPPPADTTLVFTTRSKRAAALHLFDCDGVAIGSMSGSRYVGSVDRLKVSANSPAPLSAYISDELSLKWDDGKTPFVIALDPEALFEPMESLVTE